VAGQVAPDDPLAFSGMSTLPSISSWWGSL